MSMISVIGVMLGVLVGIVLLCLAVTRMEKTAKSSEYDERQHLVRGRGYRLAFWVEFLYLLIVLPLMVAQVDGEKTVEPYLLIFGGFMVQNFVFHVYCLLNHADLPMSQKPLGTALAFLVCGISWTAPFCNTMKRGSLTLVGYGSEGWIYLMTSVTFLSMSAMHLIQLLRREKE